MQTALQLSLSSLTVAKCSHSVRLFMFYMNILFQQNQDASLDKISL